MPTCAPMAAKSNALRPANQVVKKFQDASFRVSQLSPGLFSGEFCDRIAARYRFASVRASSGALIPEVAKRETGWKRTGLRVVERLIPRGLPTVRVALAFLIMRPFDIVPTLWNRALGCTVVRACLKLRGGKRPALARAR